VKSLMVVGVALLWIGLPATIFAQRPPEPGKLAIPPMELWPTAFSAEPHAPAAAAAHPVTVADVPDEQHNRHMNILWKASIMAMLAATSVDAVSSWHKQEGNALLASADGTFGAKGVGIKAGLAAGILLPQIMLRKHKDLRVAFVVGNLTEASVFTGAAIRNFRQGAP
jgi:hypothetical protein